MVYSIINLGVIFGICYFYGFTLRHQHSLVIDSFYPLINVCIIQASLVLVLYILEILHIYFAFLIRVYIFTVYYFLIVLFNFACTYAKQKPSQAVTYLTSALMIFVFIYCIFYLEIPTVTFGGTTHLINNNIFLALLELGHYAYTPYALILPISSILIFIGRAIVANDTVLKYKFILMSLVYVTVFSFYLVLAFGGSSKESHNFLFSLATLYCILVLFRISLVCHIPSINRIIKTTITFFWEYTLFALIVSFAFVVFFYALSINMGLFSVIGSIIIFLLFFAQAFARKRNKEAFIRGIAEVALGNFFSRVDYNANRSELIDSFGNMLTDVFDASGIEFYALDGEELHVLYSTRDFYEPKINVHENLHSILFHSKVTVFTKTSIQHEKAFSGVGTEVERLLSLCNSHAMIVIQGERNIIGLISLGEKKRSVNYSTSDLELLQYFYPNFFVFGYYLEISLKESLMNIISREIEFSGQVTESINKNIDNLSHPSVDLGYLSRSLRNLGGDFIDLIRLTDKRHMFVVGDVSGRGLNASMCMIILKSFIRTFLNESDNFIELINKLNSFIKHNLPRGTFFAGTFMIYDSSTKMLYYVNCGVPSIFLYTKSYNNVIEIQGIGKVLGFVDNVKDLLTLKKIQLSEGDIVLTCSDGVTESLSLRGEEYGKRRIEKLLLENKLFPSQNICTFLYDDLQSFTAKGITDDVSILLLKVLG